MKMLWKIQIVLLLRMTICFGLMVPQQVNDLEEPLYLTPYIENGKIKEARHLAQVNVTENLRFKSYAGFFTVNKTLSSNQFLWYFPAIDGNANAPVILWLQGGPGGSSLFGLFYENGPIMVENNDLVYRTHNWALHHHVIYIDNPVGTGFSFTKSLDGYCTNEQQVGEQLYTTLIQFFQLFPELQKNKFFVTGESYAGKYVPALGYTIHNKNQNAKMKINLKGLAIGDGLSDPIHQMQYHEYLYQVGLIDINEKKVFESMENEIIKLVELKQFFDAHEKMDELLNLFQKLSGYISLYNLLDTSGSTIGGLDVIVDNQLLRKLIHVGNLTFNTEDLVYEHLTSDIMRSVAPLLTELLNHYDTVIYNGQLDIIIPYTSTLNYLQHLNFTGADEYKNAERKEWRVNDEIAGYVKKAGKLVEVLVRNAGHMVPRDQPEYALDMITRLTSGKGFDILL